MKTLLIIVMALLAGPLYSQTLNIKKMSNTEKAKAINQAVMKSDFNVISQLVSENYIQHTPMVADGRKGVNALLSKIEYKELPAPQITTVRSFEDGDFVVLHHDVMWPTPKVMFEIFRFENNLAVEHWSGVADHPEKTENGHTMVDGPTRVESRELTKQNKELVRGFVETVLINGEFDKLRNYYADDIIQHNPFIDNGVEGLLKGVENLQKQGVTIQIDKIWRVFGEGNFVLVCSEGKFGGKPTAYFDLFRVAKGKIAEHWDVLQPIPDKSANENGFFKASLYKRLGGYDGIAGYVDHAFPQVASHPDLQHLFIGHATETKMRQRQLIIDRLVSVMQGPVIYLGRPLETVHKGLNITPTQWNSFMGVMNKAMDERGIKGEDKEDFVHLFEYFRAMTVEEEIK